MLFEQSMNSSDDGSEGIHQRAALPTELETASGAGLAA